MMREFGETSDELARSRKHLQQAERMAMVGELAAGVAHTIRNPFTSIKMRMFSLGRSLDLTEAQDEDLLVISDEIARIDKIVENFLEFARPPKLSLQECCLGEVINSVLTLLDHRLRAYNVEVNYTFRPELSPVRVDGDRIKEALANLIINGCEAMENGGRISISETRENHQELGEVAVITISDNGPGIPKAIIDKVTSPFFTTKEDGSGLGLSIVSRIVKEHHGKFMVSSKPDQGATFVIILPAGEQPT
jgi:signal transduction histidine kinase